MTIATASVKFNASEEVIKKYVENGYIEKSGEEFEENDFRNLGIISTLQEIGLDEESIRRYLKLNEKQNTEKDRIRLLRGRRAELLDEIHEKQQSLDHLDYLIYEINGQGKKQ